MRDMVAFVPSATFPFHDLSDYVAIPRVTGLRLSPDGSWLAASVQTLSKDRKKFVTSIWRIDPQGARRTGSPGPQRGRAARASCLTARCCSPPSARRRTTARGTAGTTATGRGPGDVAAARRRRRGTHGRRRCPAGSRAGDGRGRAGRSWSSRQAAGRRAEDERLRKERKDAGVTAILHETVPVRYWDHDLGPADPRLFAVTPPGADSAETEDSRYETARPHPGRGPGAVPAVGRAEPGRNAGRGHLVALARWRAGTPGGCADRPRHRQADRAAHRP